MFEAGPDQPDVINAMFERLPGDPDAEIANISKVGQTKAARFVSLAEDHLLLGSIYSPPGADAPFYGPSIPGARSGCRRR